MRIALAAAACLLLAGAAHAQCRDSKMAVSIRELTIGNDGDFRYVAEVANGAPPYSYAWTGTVGNAEFQSDQRMTPIFLPYIDRYAEVVVTDKGGCTAKQAIGTLPPISKAMCTTLGYSPVPTPGALQSEGREIHFSGNGVAWRVALEQRGLKGVALGLVQIKRPGDTSWNTVLKNAGPTEIFVPYHNGTTRLYDMMWCAPSGPNLHPCLRQVTPADSSPVSASQITFPGSTYPTVAQECRDAGLAALCKSNAAGEFGASVRYKEVVFWSVYDTGNYDYVVEYGFRNDGTITFRAGATGYNHGGHPFTAHMHDIVWRVDIDLWGAGADRAFGVSHDEPSPFLAAMDNHTPFFYEGTLDWNAEGFDMIVVEDPTVMNALGNDIGYEFQPWDRKGTARHWGPTEMFTQHDFWVTKNNVDEDGTGSVAPNNWGTSGGVQPDSYVSQYVFTDPSLVPGTGPEWLFGPSKTDIVVWHRSAAHHDPHDEDRRNTDTIGQMSGLTLMHWQGFDLVPHNLMAYNPVMPTNICWPN